VRPCVYKKMRRGNRIWVVRKGLYPLPLGKKRNFMEKKYPVGRNGMLPSNDAGRPEG